MRSNIKYKRKAGSTIRPCLASFLGLSESAFHGKVSTSRRLLEPHERLLEDNRQAEITVLVNISESALRVELIEPLVPASASFTKKVYAFLNIYKLN